jgi:transposase InsO family protein
MPSSKENRMQLHANAKLGPAGRAVMVDRILRQGWSVAEAAEAAGVSEQTCRKWLRRARAGDGLEDRSSVPKRQPRATPPDLVEAVLALRRLRMTAAEIAECLQLPLSTTSDLLRRHGLGKRSALGPVEPANRYEHAAPGDLIHIDVKKLARFHRPGHRMLGRGPGRWDAGGANGFEFLHVAIDDHSRLGYAEVLADERTSTVLAFLRRALAFFARHGITVRRLLTDNGSAYRSHAHRLACVALGIRHQRTRPRRPRTNGKAERFIQTLLNEWAYVRLYASSGKRNQALAAYLDHYNYRRRHGSLGHKPPASRLPANNVTGNYT